MGEFAGGIAKGSQLEIHAEKGRLQGPFTNVRMTMEAKDNGRLELCRAEGNVEPDGQRTPRTSLDSAIGICPATAVWLCGD